jgi:hypothetical protein
MHNVSTILEHNDRKLPGGAGGMIAVADNMIGKWICLIHLFFGNFLMRSQAGIGRIAPIRKP